MKVYSYLKAEEYRQFKEQAAKHKMTEYEFLQFVIRQHFQQTQLKNTLIKAVKEFGEIMDTAP